MARTSKSAWKRRESKVAADLLACAQQAGVSLEEEDFTRTPLSGANSKHGGGDVIIPKGVEMLVESKMRASHAHHTLHREATEDAAKYGIDRDHVVLATSKKREEGYLVVLTSEMFKRIMSVPEVWALWERRYGKP
jgi:hypothetical protein